MSEGVFFQNLAMLMAVAGFVAVVFDRFKWPKVLGYIFAGIILSRYTWGGPFIVDEASVQTIGQLGIVFLMFSMGLGFSTSDLSRMKGVVLPVALIDVVLMTWIGYTVGTKVFGWGMVPSLFLGAAICDSATTLLAKIIGELRWNDRPFVKFVMGTSVCEDILCVGLIALITGVANGRGLSVGAMGLSMGGLGIFFVATLLVGFAFVPRLLKSVAKRGDDEALLLTVLGCCFFVSYIAYRFEFSLALGAFLVGVIGSTSDVRYRLTRLVVPLKSMFAAVFFVSIGLQVNPAECMNHIPKILFLSGIVISGKFLNCTLGALLCGQRIKTAVQLGMGLAQIGEFAFMVALLYTVATGDSATPMYQIVVAVSILTTLVNPILLKLSEPFGDFMERKCPPKIKSALQGYREAIERYSETQKGKKLAREIRNSIFLVVMFFVLNFAVAISCSLLAGRNWANVSEFFDAHKQFVFALVFNLFMVAVLAPIIKISRSLGEALADVIIGKSVANWQSALKYAIRLFVQVATVLLWFAQMTMININLAPQEPYKQLVIGVILLLALIFGWRFFARSFSKASSRIKEAMKADEHLRHEHPELPENSFVLAVPADLMHRISVPETSPAIGCSVAQLNIRAKTGANVVRVIRDGKLNRNVGPGWVFAPNDLVLAYGDNSQIAALKDMLGVISEF
ncbi:MAG: cation:proton antiporter [Kiritimatiellae bacterium]|nr:cation:proton antiporter [Kiritimatiellia bacterium]